MIAAGRDTPKLRAGDRLFVSVYNVCVVCGGKRGYAGGFATESHGRKHARIGDAVRTPAMFAEQRFVLTDEGARKANEQTLADKASDERIRKQVHG
jgi:hypothetical protein